MAVEREQIEEELDKWKVWLQEEEDKKQSWQLEEELEDEPGKQEE